MEGVEPTPSPIPCSAPEESSNGSLEAGELPPEFAAPSLTFIASSAAMVESWVADSDLRGPLPLPLPSLLPLADASPRRERLASAWPAPWLLDAAVDGAAGAATAGSASASVAAVGAAAGSAALAPPADAASCVRFLLAARVAPASAALALLRVLPLA